MSEVKAMTLAEKLLAIKSEVPRIEKNASGYNFDYADPEAVLGAINPLLLKYRVIVIPQVDDVQYQTLIKGKGKSGEDKTETLYHVKMSYDIINVDNPDQHRVVPWGGSGCNGDEQGFGSALTYSLRYFFLNQFQIPTSKDDPDAKKKNKPPIQERKPQPVRTGQPAQSAGNKSAAGTGDGRPAQYWQLVNTELGAFVNDGKIPRDEVQKIVDKISGRVAPHLNELSVQNLSDILFEVKKVIADREEAIKGVNK